PDGPYRDRPSYDSVAQAYSGFLGLLVNPNDPRVVGPALADAITGFYSAYGILGALHERHQTGRGRRVEVSMIEAMTHFNLDAFTHLFSIGQVMDPFSRARVSQSYVLECADGKWIALHMSSPPKFWEGLAKAMDRPDIFDDPRFSTREARIDHQEAMIELLQGIFRQRTRTQWCNRLVALDVPHAPMYTPAEVPEDPQIKHLELFVSAPSPVQGTFRTVRSPVSYDRQRSLQVTAPPVLGQHNDAFKNGWPAPEA
ncbi:MAG: CaiB/BaiF CoA transferase family protein, partial [Steroidobacteraceae bacterium]